MAAFRVLSLTDFFPNMSCRILSSGSSGVWLFLCAALDDWQEWMLPYFWLYALLDCMLLYGHNRRGALRADTEDNSTVTSHSNGGKDVDHSLAGEEDKSEGVTPTLAKVTPSLSSSSPPSSHSRLRGRTPSLLQHSTLQRYPRKTEALTFQFLQLLSARLTSFSAGA